MDLAEQAEMLPTTAGVYLFRDRHGEVLYVGKAANLRARVRQYLGGHDERFMVRYLVAASARVEAVPVATEKEALLMENALIKQHQPRYNVKLRDDKNFLHIRLDARESWPRLTLVRRPTDDGARYFGPYHSATQARRTQAFVQRYFALRTCTDGVLASRERPCLLHQLGRCVAPCVGLVTAEAYGDIVADAGLALAGRNRELLPRLRERMVAQAAEERFEEAARTRDLVRSLEGSLQRQAVVDVRMGDRDAWGLHREADRGVAAVLCVREGVPREPLTWPFEGEVVDDAALLSALVNRWYHEAIPPEILLPLPLPDEAALAEVLRERRGARVELRVPQRGDKTGVLDIARRAAESRFLTSHGEAERVQRALETIAEIVGLDAVPWRMECFDNSNLLGQEPVASQVVFIEGRPARKEYRRYHVKTVTGADDYATMREILARRLKRGMEADDLPDLLVVDGGRGQLGAAEDVLRELRLEHLPTIGIAKPRTARARGDRDAVDKIILRGSSEPVMLRHDDPALRMLQHLRDEAHRTAIGFHRKSRSKARLVSALDGVEGVGPARRKALLVAFGSVAGIRAATLEEVASVVGPALAERVVKGVAG
jgi:excinuclease ABC subunit C